jgi:hypothetical protein
MCRYNHARAIRHLRATVLAEIPIVSAISR